ncbi:unnamed protein product [Triticum turgidum subsp. durum]|uniref:Uncharacterized protein n=1 Tax=Triticum turgidum subsp. durum TaxID=4567 RepID=A0A9R1R3U0_TRITD|nr:unnamed protein product [Triticum turgidum subsp. durum]
MVWNGLVAVVCFFDVFVILLKKNRYMSGMELLLMTVILAIGRFLSGLKLHICKPLRRATSLWSPLVAILLLAPSLSDRSRRYIYGHDEDQTHIDPSTRWVVFTTLLVPVLLMYMLRLDVFVDISTSMIIQVCALAVLSFGNFQIPAAVLRIVLAILGLQHVPEYGEDDENLKASLRIFYGMVLGQGIFYSLVCMLEFFSFIPQRYLVHRGGFRGQCGVESVNVYYAYALEKCMQEGVLAPKKISLTNFAMDSLNSYSSKNQLHGIRLMHSFLQWQPTRAQLLSKLTTSTNTVARIIRMLDWTSPKDTTIRLYAAKVTAELAKDLCVVAFPGTMQTVSALLDADSSPKRGNPLLDTDDEKEERQDQFLKTEDSQEQEHHTVRDVAVNQSQRQDPLQDTNYLLEETQTCSTQKPLVDKKNSYIIRCWQRIKELRSLPKEQPSTDHDLLPALAMSIIESLAGDQENCVEISKATNLIPKIIGFTRFVRAMSTMDTEAEQKVMLKSSLKVLQRLTGIGGEIGITLRYKISKHPFLLRNLAEILKDNITSQESRKLVAGILMNIAIDGNTRQDIGRIQLIITRLKQTFLNEENPMIANADHLSRKAVGQALAMLTTESAQNCLIVLQEPDFIKKLKHMILIHDGKYIYAATSLLRNLCLHSRHELRESDLKELSHILREVLEKIIDVEGVELEIIIGLSSLICKERPFSDDYKH